MKNSRKKSNAVAGYTVVVNFTDKEEGREALAEARRFVYNKLINKLNKERGVVSGQS